MREFIKKERSLIIHHEHQTEFFIKRIDTEDIEKTGFATSEKETKYEISHKSTFITLEESELQRLINAGSELIKNAKQ